MGLDSVELVISIEKHFAISISDSEAERAMTVQDVADLVAKHRPVVSHEHDVRLEVRDKLLSSLPVNAGSITDDSRFSEICQGRKPSEVWSSWSVMELKLPSLPPKDAGGKLNSVLLFLLPKWVSGRSVLELNFGQIVDAVVAHNHQTLIDPLKPRSRYEILMAVIGLSSDKLGIAELEIRPTDSYVNDLGID